MLHADSDARAAGRAMVTKAKEGRPAFICVNNHLEGNALQTIEALLES